MSEEDESIVIRPRDHADIIRLSEPDILEQFLDRPATEVLDIIAGAFAVGKPGLITSGRRLALGLLKGRMYQQFASEIKTLRDAGKLPDDFADQKNGFYTWAELMAIIDDECPDADRLEALKAMFYAMNKANTSDMEKILAYQLWNLTKQLRSGELYLLRVIKQEINHLPTQGGYQRWAEYLAQKTGFTHQGLIDMYEKRLTDLFLLTPRQHSDGSGVSSANGRLTGLGLSLCNNIDTYRIDLASASSAKHETP